MIYVRKIDQTWTQIHGNPTLTKLDGSARATWHTITSPGWPADYPAQFGAHQIDVTPPEGKQWTGEIVDVDGLPVPEFVDTPPAPVPTEVEGWQAEVAMKATHVDLEDEQSQTIWARVQDLIAAMPAGIEKLTAQTVLARGRIRRDSPTLASLSAMVPLSEARVDDLMRLADSIQA